MKRISRILAGTTGISFILASCGAPPPHDDFDQGDAHGCNEKVVPPKEYYDALMTERVKTMSLAAPSSTQTLYINFNGAEVEKGYGRGQSFILCESRASIPGSGFSYDEQQEVVTRVQDHFSTAGVALSVTTTKPLSGDYTTIHVGGSYGSLGCQESPSTLGIAPFDEGNQNRNDIGFVFTAYEIDSGVIADAIAHESGHSFGLDHTVNIKDLMHPSARSDNLAFAISQIRGSSEIQDGPKLLRLNVGSLPAYVDPADATNGGTSNGGTSTGGSSGSSTVKPGTGNGGLFSGISTLAGLMNQLQPDQILNIMSLLPGFASMVPGLSNGTTSPFPGGNYAAVLAALPGLDKINTLVAMAAPGLTNATGAAGLDPATIATLAALAAFGGYGSVPAALLGANTALTPLITMILDMLGLNLANSGALPDPTQIANQLPPYMNAYNLGGIATAPALLAAMSAQQTYIQTNYSGAQQQALTSGLIVAASQAYVLLNQ